MLSAPRPHADIPSLPEGTARRHRQDCRRGELPSEHWTGRTVHRSRGSGRRPSGCERHGMLSGHPFLPAPFSGSGSCRPVEISARSGGRSPRWATLHHALIIAANGCIYLFQRHFYTSSKNSFVKENSFFRGRRGIGLSLLREPVFYVAQALQQQRIESTVLSCGQRSDASSCERASCCPACLQTVIGIRQRYHLCRDGDVIALPAIGIAAAVPALMVPAAGFGSQISPAARPDTGTDFPASAHPEWGGCGGWRFVPASGRGR